ncbi:MAG TPA: methyltransferase [Gemmataceae bacterium]|jgi:hypothetical protein|nr:methyltransferase [Gemmataceae bacterium]
MPQQETASTPADLPPQLVIRQMLTGYWMAQGVYVVAKLGIADLVKDGPKNADELAKATGVNARSLYRLLRALASVGVFAEDAGGRFRLTPPAACLLSDAPGSQRAAALMMGEEHFRCWTDLLYSIETGETAFEHVYGEPVFTYLATHPHAAKVFDEAMTSIHGAETGAMLAVYDFSPVRTLVDVGGGNGTLLTTVLRKYPSMRGILFDRPDVIERARANLKAAGLEERCQAVAGSFFESVPPGGDAYLLRHIVHDWDDGECQTILRNCRKVMPQTGRLLVIESVIPPGNEPCFGKLLDVNMLVIPGGMERTEPEYRDLFAKAGFTLSRVVPTDREVSVVEGQPA